MTIITSVIVDDMPQRDGRRFVRERHTDQYGVIQEVTYLAEALEDVAVAMASRVVMIEQQVINGELETNASLALSDLAFQPPTLRYCTALQLRNHIRLIYAAGKGFHLCRLAWYIQRLGLTDNQLKSMFGVNDAGLPAVKAKLSSLESKYDDVQAQVGS